MATATSSAKSASRASVSGGGGCTPEYPTIAEPHKPAVDDDRRAHTPERRPRSRISAATGPAACSWLFILAVRPVRNTIAATLSPSSLSRAPTGSFVKPTSSCAATTSPEPSSEKRTRVALQTPRVAATLVGNRGEHLGWSAHRGQPVSPPVATRLDAAPIHQPQRRTDSPPSRGPGPDPPRHWPTAQRARTRPARRRPVAGSAPPPEPR